MKFPLTETVVMYGEAMTYELKEGQKAKCRVCGQTFQISSETCKKQKGFNMVICPNIRYKDEETGKVTMCKYKCDAYYYMKRRKAR